MSLKRGEEKIEILYVGLDQRKEALPDGRPPTPKDLVYTITKDGKSIFHAPYVTLDAGTSYLFVINTPGYPFYITTDPHGGGVLLQPIQSMIGAIDIVPESTIEKGNVGLDKGRLKWVPAREHAQMKLYYQCNYYPDMGKDIAVRLV